MNVACSNAKSMRMVRSQQDLLNQEELRIQYKNYYLQFERLKKKLIACGMDEYETYTHMPIYPREFHYLRCGAKTRAGTPCKMKSIYSNSRCKLHGGLSTGPRSKKGKAKVAKNGLRVRARKKQTP